MRQLLLKAEDFDWDDRDGLVAEHPFIGFDLAGDVDVLNPLLDAVEAALAPAATTGVQDLGLPAMVQHAAIAGKIDTDEGTLGDQAVAIIPVEILCL